VKTRRRLFTWRTREEIAVDLDDEIAFHLDMRTRALEREGLDPAAARRKAEREFGDLVRARRALAREDRRAVRAGRWRRLCGEALQDVRFGLRLLGRAPGFTIAAVATLAVGIGVNAAVFSVVDAVVLRPLPVAAPHRLVRLWGSNLQTGRLRGWTSPANLEDWRARARAFETIAGWTERQWELTGAGDPLRLDASVVTAGYFHLLGLRPARGRLFVDADHGPGAPAVAVVSDAFWRGRLGAAPDAVGRTLRLDGQPVTIVGILPRGAFTLSPPGTGVWLPLPPDPERGSRYLHAAGRLADGVTRAQAADEMRAIMRDLEAEYPRANTGLSVLVEPLQASMVGDVGPLLLVFLACAAAVLAVACANVAGLKLARAAARDREFAVRRALGAGRARLVRQVLAEGVVLAGLATAVVLPVVFAITGGLPSMLADVPRAIEIRVGGRLMAFAVLMALGAGTAVSLPPALRRARASGGAPRAGGSGGAAGTGAAALIVAEVALSLALLVGAGLLLKSLWRLEHVAPGFDPAGVVTFDLRLPAARYTSPERVRRFADDLLERLGAQPGTAAVGLTTMLPFGGGNSSNAVSPSDRPDVTIEAENRSVAGAFFDALRIPIARGRGLASTDTMGARPVVVVNETLARLAWPGADPLGRRLRFRDRDWEVVGVTGDVRHFGFAGDAPPELYVSFAQLPRRGVAVVLRVTDEERRAAAPIRDIVAGLDPNLPVADLSTMDAVVARSVRAPRTRSALIAVAAAVALLVATIGISGLVSQVVGGRTAEIGVRLALGATRWRMAAWVARTALGPVGLGLGLGVALAAASARVWSRYLFAVDPADVSVYALAVTLLFATAALAAALPARRAARVDPVTALRTD